ncbi:MAG: methyl-accepting chemotaxis protein [Candidatus Vecturithrix sp.]|jgi:methyl-accepting chemotaxis protein|nr:methyl-accepting chemotaxis protein [Candidatus Vecturithrix sp.]
MIQSSLRTKILFSVGFIIFIVLGTSTFIHIRDVKQDYLDAIERQSKALAQGILIDMKMQEEYKENGITSVQELFQILSLRCSRIYDLSKEQDIIHIALIDEYGRMIAHNGQRMDVPQAEHAALLQHIQRRAQITLLAGNTYHSLIPMYLTTNVYIGSIDIGVAKQVVDDKVREVLNHAVFLFVLFLIAALCLLSLLMHVLLTRPVKYLITLGQRLAEGRPIFAMRTSGRRDEIGSLSLVFSQISAYFQNVAAIASQIAQGLLTDDFETRSSHDVLGNAVQDMLVSLRNTANLMLRIAAGDLTTTAAVRSEADAFGMVIQAMTEGLRRLITQIRSSAEQIAATGVSISSLAASDIDLVEQINIAMQTMMRTMLQTGDSVEIVARNMDILSASVEETSASVAQMTNSITEIALNTNALNERSHQTIHALNETTTLLREVVQSAEISRELSQKTIHDALTGQQAVEQVMRGMDTIHATIMTGVEAIARFTQRSEEIHTILDVIHDITSQTSLLALNASIIAAQAGTHGRGFAVVAEEIKNLANGVEASTKDIAGIVSALQQETQQVVTTIHTGAAHVRHGIAQTQEARVTLEQILVSARRASSLVTDITEALSGLMTTGKTVSTAVQAVNTMTDDIRLATTEQTSSTHQINQAIEHITQKTSQIQEATTDQLNGVQQVLEAANQVNILIKQNLTSSQHIVQTTGVLSNEAQTLLNAVDRFTI